MKAIKTGAFAIGIGILATGAMQSPPRGNATELMPAEVNVTNDLTNRYGEVQIAINPKNPKNIVFVQNQMAYTYACQAAKDPTCELVPTRMGGFGGGGGGGAGAAGARPPGSPPAAPGGAPGAAARPPGGGGGGGGGALMSDHPVGFFSRDDFSTVGVFTSFDGGKTWKRAVTRVPSPQYPDLTSWGDPSVGVTPDGTFYLSYDNMDWGTAERALPKSIVGISKSTDGGLTWTSPVATGTPIDAPKTVVDSSTGTIYEASGFGNRQLVSSKDGVTWTKPNGIGGSDGTRTYGPGFGSSMSAAHGMIAFSFRVADAAACTFFVGGGAPCLVFQTSTDSGATWKRYRVPVTGSYSGATLAADPSKKGHFAVVVQDERPSRFRVYQTNNAGGTWTETAVLAEDPTKLYYHAWATYSPKGVLGLVWRSRQPIPGQAAAGTGPAAGGGTPLPYNVWAAISRDGGKTFSKPLKVSTADSPAPQGGTFGNNGDDYSGIALHGDYAYFGWADWRPGERQGFFRAIHLDAFKP